LPWWRHRSRDDASDLIKRGKHALDDGRWAEAESGFSRAAAIGSGDYRLRPSSCAPV
jgi:hypothetical protein